MPRFSTNYLHMSVLIGEGNLTKEETKNFCIIYAINTDPFPKSDNQFDGNFHQLWKMLPIPPPPTEEISVVEGGQMS